MNYIKYYNRWKKNTVVPEDTFSHPTPQFNRTPRNNPITTRVHPITTEESKQDILSPIINSTTQHEKQTSTQNRNRIHPITTEESKQDTSSSTINSTTHQVRHTLQSHTNDTTPRRLSKKNKSNKTVEKHRKRLTYILNQQPRQNSTPNVPQRIYFDNIDEKLANPDVLQKQNAFRRAESSQSSSSLHSIEEGTEDDTISPRTRSILNLLPRLPSIDTTILNNILTRFSITTFCYDSQNTNSNQDTTINTRYLYDILNKIYNNEINIYIDGEFIDGKELNIKVLPHIKKKSHIFIYFEDQNLATFLKSIQVSCINTHMIYIEEPYIIFKNTKNYINFKKSLSKTTCNEVNDVISYKYGKNDKFYITKDSIINCLETDTNKLHHGLNNLFNILNIDTRYINIFNIQL